MRDGTIDSGISQRRETAAAGSWRFVSPLFDGYRRSTREGADDADRRRSRLPAAAGDPGARKDRVIACIARTSILHSIAPGAASRFATIRSMPFVKGIDGVSSEAAGLVPTRSV